METNFHDDRGFTLVELMVVFAILFVLVTIAVPTYAGVVRRAERRACHANQKIAENAASLYQVMTGRWPQDLSILVDGSGDVGQLLGHYPECPAGGTYRIDPETGRVSCKKHDHFTDADPGG